MIHYVYVVLILDPRPRTYTGPRDLIVHLVTLFLDSRTTSTPNQGNYVSLPIYEDHLPLILSILSLCLELLLFQGVFVGLSRVKGSVQRCIKEVPFRQDSTLRDFPKLEVMSSSSLKLNFTLRPLLHGHPLSSLIDLKDRTKDYSPTPSDIPTRNRFSDQITVSSSIAHTNLILLTNILVTEPLGSRH